MFQCVYCRADVDMPLLCFKCHDVLWCSVACMKYDNVHEKFCHKLQNDDDIFSTCLMFESLETKLMQRVPIKSIDFVSKLCHHDYTKAWNILQKNKVKVVLDHFICDVLTGPEIIQMHARSDD